MAGIPIKYRTKDFQNITYKKCSPLVKIFSDNRNIETHDEYAITSREPLIAIRTYRKNTKEVILHTMRQSLKL